MEQHRKILNIGLSIIAGIAFIGFIVGTFLDRQITQTVGDMDNIFGILFTLLTPVFSLAVGEVAGAILFFMPRIKSNIWDIVLRLLGAAMFIGFSAFAIKEGIEYVKFPLMAGNEDSYKVLAITLIVLIDIAIILFVKVSIKHMDEKRIIPTIIVIFIIIAAWLFVSEVIKYLVSRPRPRGVYYDPYYEFRNWYEFKPFLSFKSEYKDCKSFVSGHTFIATCLVGCIPLIHSLSKEKSGKTMTTAGIIMGGLFSFLTAYSRIVAYAHFMTDVMGAIIASCAAQAVILNVAPSIYKRLKK